MLVSIGVALLLEHVIVEVRTTIRWLLAGIFLALALSPLVDLVERARVRSRSLPRWLAILVAYLLFFVAFGFLVLNVIPPIVREVEQLGGQLPGYVKDFEGWAENNQQFADLNDKYDITKLLTQEASQLPARLGDAAGAAKDVSVGVLNNLAEAIVVLTLSYFLLLDGGRQFDQAVSRLRAPHRERVHHAGVRIAQIVRAYVSVNLTLAALAGVFTWLSLELLGVELAVPLAVLVAIFDLVPLIGFTIGGLLVAVVAALHDFPTALIVWGALFLVYQQLQDRVIQPIFYRSAVRIHPVVAIVVVLAGAQLAGILGALLAIPIAASLGAIYDELWPSVEGSDAEEGAAGDSAEPAPAPAG
ncbi:MAG: AI-2E family transporter [Solirubrobacterales bacterium]